MIKITVLQSLKSNENSDFNINWEMSGLKFKSLY